MDSPSPDGGQNPSRWRQRIPLVLGELLVLGAAWYFMKLVPVLVGAIAGVIVLAFVVPERYDSVAGGAGMLGLSALVYFYFGNTPLAAVLAVFALVLLATGIPKALARAPAGPEATPPA